MINKYPNFPLIDFATFQFSRQYNSTAFALLLNIFNSTVHREISLLLRIGCSSEEAAFVFFDPATFIIININISFFFKRMLTRHVNIAPHRFRCPTSDAVIIKTKFVRALACLSRTDAFEALFAPHSIRFGLVWVGFDESWKFRRCLAVGFIK